MRRTAQEDDPDKIYDEAKDYLEKNLKKFKKGSAYWNPPHNYALNNALMGFNAWIFTILPFGWTRWSFQKDPDRIIIDPNWSTPPSNLNFELRTHGGVYTPNLVEMVKEFHDMTKRMPTVQETVGKELDSIEKNFGIKIPPAIRSKLIKDSEAMAARRWGANRLNRKQMEIPFDMTFKGRLNRVVIDVVKEAFRKKAEALPIGETIEVGDLRIHRYRPTVEVTDLTNAGKRGKKVSIISFESDWEDRDENRIEDLIEALVKLKDFSAAEKLIKGANVKFFEHQMRGVDIKPKGFKRIEIHTKELYIKADYNSFTIKDMTDMHNEPTCIPAMKGPKTSVNQFYRWITDNQSYSQSMTYHEVLNELRKMGIDYHEYCAVD